MEIEGIEELEERFGQCPIPPSEGACVLEIIKGGLCIGEIKLTLGFTVLGRNSKKSHQVLDHQSISRRHAAILYSNVDPPLLKAVDLGSAHGTILNGVPLKANELVELIPGSELRFGSSSRSYKLKSPNTIAPANSVASSREQRVAEIEAIMEGLSQPPQSSLPPVAHVSSSGKTEDESLEDEAGQLQEEEPEQTTQHLDHESDVRHIAARLRLPISHEVSLGGHTKAVTALSVDPAGGRVATGGVDYKVHIYDFGGMDRHHRPFRSIEPEEGNSMVSLSFSNTGDRFLACTGSRQPKVYDRDGLELHHFALGDVYIRDLTKTKGHTQAVTVGQWHPESRDTVLTASLDGSVRLWDLNGPTTFDKLHCKRTLRIRCRRGRKVPVTSASLNPDGKMVVAGGQGGSLHLLPLSSYAGKSHVVDEAHGCGVVTSTIFHEDGHLLASRGTDSIVRLWDVRKFSSPLKSFPGVDTHYEMSGLCFSSDGRVLCAGTNVNPKSQVERGVLQFYDVYGSDNDVRLDASVVSTPGVSVICTIWHPKTEQIFATTSAGSTKVLYDPEFSVKGALLSASKKERALDYDFARATGPVVGEVHLPHALPMYKEESKKRQQEAARKDPKRTKIPEAPRQSLDQVGRGTSAANYTQFIMQNKLVSKSSIRDEDPQAELLKYAEQSDANPVYLCDAWKGRKLADQTLEEEEAKFIEDQKKILDGTTS